MTAARVLTAGQHCVLEQRTYGNGGIRLGVKSDDKIVTRRNE